MREIEREKIFVNKMAKLSVMKHLFSGGEMLKEKNLVWARVDGRKNEVISAESRNKKKPFSFHSLREYFSVDIDWNFFIFSSLLNQRSINLPFSTLSHSRIYLSS
jgi:hypothetical protein